MLNNASEVDDECKDLAQDQAKDYEYWTRREFVIENILLERQGYFSEKNTDKVLEFMTNQITKLIKKIKFPEIKQAVK